MNGWSMAVAFVPALLLMGYGVFKTRGSWTSPGLWIGFLAGAGAGVLAIGIERLLVFLLGLGPAGTLPTTPTEAVLQGFVVAALPEEVLKLGALLLVVRSVLDGRRLQDVLLAAVCVAMGFAGLENMMYLITARGQWQMMAFLRSVSAVPMHGVCGLLMGALLTLMIARNGNRAFGLSVALLLPVALHGTYDTLLLMPGWSAQTWKVQGTALAMLWGGLAAMWLCGRAIAAARRIDGPDLDRPGIDLGLLRNVVSWVARIYVGLLLFAVVVSEFKATVVWGTAFFAVMPIVLALDILFTRPRSVPVKPRFARDPPPPVARRRTQM